MNPFDSQIVHFLNRFAVLNSVFDNVMWFMTHNVLVIGGIPMMLFWYAWIRYGKAGSRQQEILILGVPISIFALLVARVLAFSLPFRLRPFANPALHFTLPYGADPSSVINWSSFPSDRATLFFCIATMLWIVSKPLGKIAFLYTFLVICVPAVYAGIHYPTDILGGAALGIGIACLGEIDSFRVKLTRPATKYAASNPAVFYAMLFLITFEIAQLFGDFRHIVLYAVHVKNQAG